jgi:hypothetical protein
LEDEERVLNSASRARVFSLRLISITRCASLRDCAEREEQREIKKSEETKLELTFCKEREDILETQQARTMTFDKCNKSSPPRNDAKTTNRSQKCHFRAETAFVSFF